MVDTTTEKGVLEELQDQFAIIDIGGEIRVVDKVQITSFLSGESSSEPAFYKKADAILLMKRALEKLPFPSKPQIVINDFWVSPMTTVYQGTAFSPKPTSASSLNFWIDPRESDDTGNATFILNYLFDVICNGDQASYDYLLNYLAHMIQQPEEKPGVMLVLLGGQGTGKGMFFNLLKAIWYRTTLSVTDVDQVIGRFNACLEHNYAICMDEALFAGDRKALDRLKSMITEAQINVEQKYQPARSINSVHRFFAASNHDHFAHIEMDDRRFVFLRVSDVYKQDTNYFSQLASEIKDLPTIAAFVHQLEHIDLRSFDVRKKPASNEHMLQKLKSLVGFDRYWYEVLLSGDFDAGASYLGSGCFWQAPMFIPTSELVRRYTTFNRNAQRHQTVQSADVVAAVLRLCPSSATDRQLYQQASLATKTQKRGLQLPDIATARADFERVIRGRIQWV